MSRDEIYKILIDYIQEDNRWKDQMNKTVSSIEAQTKLTNGRLNKLEPVVESLESTRSQASIAKTLNWKWILGILAIIEILFTAAIAVALDWIKKQIH